MQSPTSQIQGMEIKIPSPSAILDPPSSSPPSAPPATTTTGGGGGGGGVGSSSSSLPAPSVTASAPLARSSLSAARTSTAGGHATSKPKQSKSRNGCITCKTKRLKCDESKPTCLQCERRKVQCGGYKKDFKWRPFEETNAANRTSAKARNVTLPPPPPTTPKRRPLGTASRPISFAQTETSQGSPPKSRDGPSGRRLPQKNTLPRVEEQDSLSNLDAMGTKTPESLLGDLEISGPTPWLSDLFPSSVDSDGTPLSVAWTSSPSKSDNISFSALLAGDNDEIEEIVRQSDPGAEQWLFPPDFGLSSSENEPHMAASIPREPELGAASPEMLVLRFNRSTCGILSVKDGLHENPWRTLIWPLAKDTPALHHAIFSLAAFHSCKENPALRVHGVDHMRKSITYMVQDIENMRTDAALATSLALAFADTWDQHTRSCIQHLRGAKALVSQVLDLAIQGKMHGADLARVRFLYNTWLYMDVIARLTSQDGCEGPQMDLSIFQLPSDVVHEIDPLMGCAATLFPLINQVAGLVQRVRKSESNSISLVSQAIELKRLIEQWEPPRWFEPPEDPTSEVQHSIQTAHAYRWATLLYLHQAVPEMPSDQTSELAKRVLILLATVPPSSRTIIIQMFPLLAAGCEAEQEEDRDWVLNRWMTIQSRLMLGGIDRCLEVVREVWARRDAYKTDQERKHKRSRSNTVYGPVWGREEQAVPSVTSCQTPRRASGVSGLENIEHEKTVRGRLHWVNVMEKWGWEVFLG